MIHFHGLKDDADVTVEELQGAIEELAQEHCPKCGKATPTA